MITKFKIFEKLITESAADNLVDQFEYNFIEEWYDDNYKIGLSEIISMSSQDDIMNCFDDDKYKRDFIRDYYYEFSEFEKSDLKRYVKEKMDEDKEKKILEIYNRNNYDEDDESSEKETEYDDYMLDELDDDELREVIEDSNEESTCTDWIIESWYDGQDGQDIFDDFCGLAKENGKYGNYKYGSFELIDGSELYNKISNYIDDDKLKKEWNDNNIDYDSKKDAIKNNLDNSPELQRQLIKMNPDNASELIELWEENNNSTDNIGDEYDFQKAYINKYLKDNITDDEDAKDEDYISTLKEDALLFLHENFGVNDDIAKEYEPYMWKVIAKSKYNL